MPTLEDPHIHEYLSETPTWFRERFEPFERAHLESGQGPPGTALQYGELTYLPGAAGRRMGWIMVSFVVLSIAVLLGVMGLVEMRDHQPATGSFVACGIFVVLGILTFIIAWRASSPRPEHAVRNGIYLLPEGLVMADRDRFATYPRETIHAFTQHRREGADVNHRPTVIIEETMYLADGRYVRLPGNQGSMDQVRMKRWLSAEGRPERPAG